MRPTILNMLAICILVAGCDWNPLFDDSGPSFFVASLDGAVEADYEGTGEFSSGTYPWGTISFNLGSHSDSAKFGFNHFGDVRRLQEGTYSFALLRGSVEELRGTMAHYSRMRPDGLMEYYISDSGTLRITESNSDRVDGTFEFSGIQYCVRTPNSVGTMGEGPCRRVLIPDPIPSDLPRITVTGSFSTTRDVSVVHQTDPP